MITVTIFVIAGIAVPALAYWDEPATPALALVLTLAAAALTFLGVHPRGSLPYAYGLNVETPRDHPSWNHKATAVLPGHEYPAVAASTTYINTRSQHYTEE